jgi:undecaprenyl-diphosphatase
VIELSMLWIALLLGVVEGVTEFLPISSTGHLILASALAGFEGPRAKLFQIFIQLGAVLAVVWEYRARLGRLALAAVREASARVFALRLFVAFAPAAVGGLLWYDKILTYLFRPVPVAGALIAGGILIFVVEALPHRAQTLEAESTNWGQALGIGLAQCLSLWPGFSRSAATILGGLAVGLGRRAATEFSFFLAIPTLGGATVYSLYRNARWLEHGDALWLGVAFVVSFLVAWASIRWLLRFVSTHSFRPFAWYRLALGTAILLGSGLHFIH